MGLAAELASRLLTKAWPEPDDQPWRQARFAVVDIETTGLDLKADEILSIGIVPIRGGRVEPTTFYSLSRPRCPITAEAMKIHALTPSEVANAPTCDEVMNDAKDHLRGRVIVAHAAWVERAFIDRVLRNRRERLPRGILDTAALARATGLSVAEPGEPSLEWLARTLGLPVHTPHHALGDAATTALVLLALVARLERERGALAVGDLLRLSSRHAH